MALFFNPFIATFDNSGNQASGWKLKFYVAGTSTAKNVYSDASLSTSIGNIITLNSRGEPSSGGNPVNIYGSGNYKVVITTDADVTVNTIDNFTFGIGADTVLDTNGNELLEWGTTASAVNNLKITNAATGNGPILEARGGDSNVPMNFQAKGTGTYNFKATSSQSAYLRMYEDTDNGTNYIEQQAPSSLGGNRTVTWPDRNVNLTPIIFRAFKSASSQTITQGAGPTKVVFDGEFYDIGSCFDSATNYRFTPTVAGYYQVNLVLNCETASATATVFTFGIWKNGSPVEGVGSDSETPATSGWEIPASASGIIQMNGTTDYLEVYASSPGGAADVTISSGNGSTTNFSGHLIAV